MSIQVAHVLSAGTTASNVLPVTLAYDLGLAYSTDGVKPANMLTVTNTADNHTAQSYVLPAGINGTVDIRVTDTDQTRGHSNRDTLYIDHMSIRSTSTGGAAMASRLEEDEEQLVFSVRPRAREPVRNSEHGSAGDTRNGAPDNHTENTLTTPHHATDGQPTVSKAPSKLLSVRKTSEAAIPH